MSKNKQLIVFSFSVLVLLVAGIFYWPKDMMNATDVPCLDPDISTLKQHIHSNLKIFIDDKEITIPANIGLSSACERAVHTHDSTGKIHVEAQDKRVYKLKDFFSVWGQKMERFGYQLEMTVGGKPNTELGELILKEGQNIILKYEIRTP